MMVIGRSILILASASLLAACATSERHLAVSPEEVEGKSWVLKSLDGETPVENRRITIEFENANDMGGKVFGRGPCNTYTGNYALQKYKLDFDTLSSTRMACSEPVMMQEKRFLSAFQNIEVLNVSKDKEAISLWGPKDDTALHFVAETAEVKGMIRSSTGHFPANAMVRIQLKDLSNPSERGSVIGESKIKLRYELDAPLKFNVAYAPALVKSDHTYAMTVQVRQQGRLVSESMIESIVQLQSSEAMP